MKRAVLLSTNDERGGAAIVTLRLARALARRGVDTTMLVANRFGTDPLVEQVSAGRLPFLAEHTELFVHNGFDRRGVFALSTGRFGADISTHPAVVAADTIIIGWVNQGFLSLDTIGRLAQSKKNIIWVMHDMWNATGICHHTGECTHWADGSGCHNCPLLRPRRNSFAHRVWEKKKALYTGSNIHFVAVSQWLADRCRQSTLMAGCEVTVIPNPLDPGDAPREELTGKTVMMAAARLDDPIKGLPEAIATLNRLEGTGAEALFVGALKNPRALDGLKIPYRRVGTVTDPSEMRRYYEQASVVLSTSQFETLPTTLIEAQAAGAWPVAWLRGGQADIISDGINGSLLTYGADLAGAIAAHLTRSALRTATLRKSAVRFDPDAVVEAYISLVK